MKSIRTIFVHTPKKKKNKEPDNKATSIVLLLALISDFFLAIQTIKIPQKAAVVPQSVQSMM